mmetsp:Transcript_4494/g.13629  ORF Transcript_4494/g.13629 Transcript_4494/m.13629 type:complete len:191 (+) Transcript_4494:206-778(+)
MGWWSTSHQLHKEEKFDTFDNAVKIATSFVLLLPALNYSQGWLNPVAWVLIAFGALVHHCRPDSALAHDFDHWTALVGCGMILICKEGGVEPPVVAVYWILGALFFLDFKLRMAVTGFGIAWMSLRFGRLYSYISAIVALVSFILQRGDVPHAHSLWHIALASLGFFVTMPSATGHSFFWDWRNCKNFYY